MSLFSVLFSMYMSFTCIFIVGSLYLDVPWTLSIPHLLLISNPYFELAWTYWAFSSLFSLYLETKWVVTWWYAKLPFFHETWGTRKLEALKVPGWQTLVDLKHDQRSMDQHFSQQLGSNKRCWRWWWWWNSWDVGSGPGSATGLPYLHQNWKRKLKCCTLCKVQGSLWAKKN